MLLCLLWLNDIDPAMNGFKNNIWCLVHFASFFFYFQVDLIEKCRTFSPISRFMSLMSLSSWYFFCKDEISRLPDLYEIKMEKKFFEKMEVKQFPERAECKNNNLKWEKYHNSPDLLKNMYNATLLIGARYF